MGIQKGKRRAAQLPKDTPQFVLATHGAAECKNLGGFLL
jgi:hypothetical protein